MHIDLQGADALLDQIYHENRTVLLEHEVYRLLEICGLKTVPKTYLAIPGTAINADILESFPGNRIVLKVVAPTISHKTDVGGVKIVDKDADGVNKSIRSMLTNIPSAYGPWLESHGITPPEIYRKLDGRELSEAVNRDIRGVQITEYVSPDAGGFGYRT